MSGGYVGIASCEAHGLARTLEAAGDELAAIRRTVSGVLSQVDGPQGCETATIDAVQAWTQQAGLGVASRNTHPDGHDLEGLGFVGLRVSTDHGLILDVNFSIPELRRVKRFHFEGS